MAATTVITRAVKGSALTHNEMDSNWNNLNNVGVGVGHISMWPTSGVPDSTWLPCEGGSYATATYPDLFDVIGYQYGGAGANFNMPDYRGMFPRGWANGSTNDPDRAARTNRGDGTTGDNVGTRQADQFASHNHANGDANRVISPNTTFGISEGFAGGTAAVAMSNAGGNETRPKNVYVRFIIKALL